MGDKKKKIGGLEDDQKIGGVRRVGWGWGGEGVVLCGETGSPRRLTDWPAVQLRHVE